MKKIIYITLILFISIPFISYSEDDYTFKSPEELVAFNCKWVMISLVHNNLIFAKQLYKDQCDNPSYMSEEGYTWLSYAVDYEKLDQVEWALSLPDVNVNTKYYGQTILYFTVFHMYKNSINQIEHPRYKILKMLLEHKADPFYPNDSEGYPPYSNGESTYDLIKRKQIENTSYGRLVLYYTKRKN